jgi:hypothetical protein
MQFDSICQSFQYMNVVTFFEYFIGYSSTPKCVMILLWIFKVHLTMLYVNQTYTI